MLVQKDKQKGFPVATRIAYSLGNTLCHGRFILSRLLKGSLFLVNQKHVSGDRTSPGLKHK